MMMRTVHNITIFLKTDCGGVQKMNLIYHPDQSFVRISSNDRLPGRVVVYVSCRFSTIMSYGCTGSNLIHTRVPYFSNPNVVYMDWRTGTSDSDNARHIRDIMVSLASIGRSTAAVALHPPAMDCESSTAQYPQQRSQGTPANLARARNVFSL